MLCRNPMLSSGFRYAGRRPRAFERRRLSVRAANTTQPIQPDARDGDKHARVSDDQPGGRPSPQSWWRAIRGRLRATANPRLQDRGAKDAVLHHRARWQIHPLNLKPRVVNGLIEAVPFKLPIETCALVVHTPFGGSPKVVDHAIFRRPIQYTGAIDDVSIRERFAPEFDPYGREAHAWVAPEFSSDTFGLGGCQHPLHSVDLIRFHLAASLAVCPRMSRAG